MQGSERAIEAALDAVDAARDREVARIRTAVSLKGDEFCQDCGEPIGARRRAAMPSATRCVKCQGAREAGARGAR